MGRQEKIFTILFPSLMPINRNDALWPVSQKPLRP
jgi:hypothetical protein